MSKCIWPLKKTNWHTNKETHSRNNTQQYYNYKNISHKILTLTCVILVYLMLKNVWNIANN